MSNTTTESLVPKTSPSNVTHQAPFPQSLEEVSTNMSANLSQRVSSLEAWHSLVTPDLPSHITNLSTTVASLQDTSLLQSHAVHNLTQVSASVVTHAR